MNAVTEKTPFHSVICDLLDIRYPILQGAMQGGGGVDLVAAVSASGGLGILPTFGGTTAKLIEDIAAVKQKTDKPIAVNITAMGEGFTESRIDVCLEHGVNIITTGRADPGEKAVKRMKDEGITVISVIPTVEHAKRMVDEGVDAIVASGGEAGGHVGQVATLPLVPAVVDAVDVPVLAAGGIGDARGFLAALALGAVGVQFGTLFMATTESNLNNWGKNRLIEMAETDTLVTKAMTGAPVRCIATPENRAYEQALKAGAAKAELSQLAKEVRASRNADKSERQQTAAGQIAVLIHDLRPVGELMEEIIADAVKLARRLDGLA
jgi:enoyl-[acyl-carrier protein] reductase II